MPPDRIALLPNWVDCDIIRPLPTPSPLRAEIGLPPEAGVARSAGNLGVRPGVETLSGLGRTLPADSPLHLVVAGEGAERARLVADLKDRPRVHLLPLQPAERLNDLLNLADIHLLPQRADAADLVMPSKLSGMLASGRPVVAGAAPGTELARAIEAAGIAVPPGDVAAMLAAVDSLARDPQRRRQLGEAARARALAEWDRTAILSAFEQRLVAAAGLPGARSADRSTAAA
jgi:colanic acid biosynthesis glycosyl transferase WcaI